MPQNFIGCDRDQELLLPPNLREWLPEDHLAWFVLAAVEEMDVSAFLGAYRADGHGRSAHDPSMMLALLLYAYCKGQRSSRGIERACVEDVACRVIAANRRPDHTTIVRFRQRHETALADLFGQVLELCAEANLVQELAVECAANAAYEAYRARGVMKDGRRFGPAPKPYTPPDTPAGKANVSDPDSRNVKTPRGYMQGYNAQAVATEQQIVIAPEVNIDSSDFGHLAGMVTAAETELERAGVTDAPAVVVADAGYWHQRQMESVINRGIQVLIPPDAGKRRGTRPGWTGGAYAHMRRVLETDFGGGLYRKRKAMIEPVFANTKFNRRIDRFQRRGRSAARSEWRLITATHNLLKLHKHQIAAAAA